jgi:DNA (cytosine-5)-methyltransferase 1
VTLYNEIEPYAAAWLRNLSDAGHIARGGVDARSIRELRATDLVGATQFHTFAGLGAWSYALRLAGWPDDRPVWTGSCPCQPFSGAGAGLGFSDERHLWPEWFRLIRECRPPVVFGEQVASGAGLAWLDVVRADLEAEGYAVGAADLCAAGVGAPHIRQRLFFGAVRVADTGKAGRGLCGQNDDSRREVDEQPQTSDRAYHAGRGASGGLADTERGDGLREHGHGMGSAARGGQGEGDQRQRVRVDPADGGAVGDVANAGRPRLPARERDDVRGEGRRGEGGAVEQRDGASSPWEPVEWLACRDGKARPTQPGLLPLAHGAPARVGRLRAGSSDEKEVLTYSSRVGMLRGYGNAIVPQVAAAFIRAFMEAT